MVRPSNCLFSFTHFGECTRDFILVVFSRVGSGEYFFSLYFLLFPSTPTHIRFMILSDAVVFIGSDDEINFLNELKFYSKDTFISLEELIEKLLLIFVLAVLFSSYIFN
jgi:hypothetical protein